jgi:cytosine/adenosine deaminase-related metal-dependent hydrolase
MQGFGTPDQVRFRLRLDAPPARTPRWRLLRTRGGSPVIETSLTRPSLIRNASWAIVWDGSRGHVYRTDVDVRLADGQIAEIAPGGTLSAPPDGGVLEGRGFLLMPGLIDIHAHPSTEPSLRGIREDHGVPEQHMTGLYERSQAFRLDAEGRKAATVMAYAEMLACGVTTVADLSVPFEGWTEVMRACRLRIYAAAGFAPGRWAMSSQAVVTWNWDEAAGAKGFEHAKKILDELESSPSGRLKGIVYPLQIDTVTEELLRAAFAWAQATNRPFMSHLAQTVIEVREMIRRHGITPVEWAASLGILGPRTTMGHCIFLDEHPQIDWHSKRDLALLAETGTTVAHCPSPFARYGAALAHFARYRAAGVNVALGTDVAPHNLIEEMRTAILAGRIVSRDIRAADPGSLLHAATIAGSRALGRDDLGRIAPGAKADLALVDLTHPLMQPVRDPLRSLLYHAADRAVRTVLVDGVVAFADGRAVGLDVATAAAALAEAQARMLRDCTKHDYRGRHGAAIAPLSLPMA